MAAQLSGRQKLDKAVETPSENAPAASDPKLDNADGASESVASTFDGTTNFDGSSTFDGLPPDSDRCSGS